jgi:hypothetical protein
MRHSEVGWNYFQLIFEPPVTPFWMVISARGKEANQVDRSKPGTSVQVCGGLAGMTKGWDREKGPAGGGKRGLRL